jgi:hypothetical protein
MFSEEELEGQRRHAIDLVIQLMNHNSEHFSDWTSSWMLLMIKV